MFTEFASPSREEWLEQAGGARFASAMYGPGAEVVAAQPWRPGGWEILEAAPDGLFKIAEGDPCEQLKAAVASGARAFLVPVDTYYFEEIAKFRALRRMFDEPVRIVAITGRAHQTIYDPHVNLLRATACAMAAVIGGCDALVVRRFDEARGGDAGELAKRLAVNTQLLLREEAGFGEIVDPAAGSWYLEALTQRLIEGVSVARRRVLVGVTNYAEPQETAPPGVETSASPFERLRLAVERSGRPRPRVRLILGKNVKMARARAEFARSVFASGGFLVDEPADFGVLCGADEEYPGMLGGDLPLIVAGPPVEGAFDCVNLKSDVAAKLAGWLRHLGIES